MKKVILISLFSLFHLILNAQTQYKVNHFTTDDGLPTNSIYSITEDKLGNLVLGTDNGLTVFNGNDFKTYNVKDGLINPYIVAVMTDNEGVVWFINYGGKLQKLVNNKIVTTPFLTDFYNSILNTNLKIGLFTMQNRNKNKSYYYKEIDKINKTIYKHKNSLKSTKFALPFYCQNNKEILIHNNFLVFDNYKVEIPKDISLLHKVIFRKNDVCLLDENFLFILDFKGNILKKITLPNSLSENPVYKFDFIIDNQENCWLNIQNKGLYKLQSNNWMQVNENLGLNAVDNINFVYSDLTGRIWIATNEKGLYCILNNDIQYIKFPKENNYFNGFAYSLNKEKMFFSSKFNLYSLDRNNSIKLLKRSENEIKIENYNSIPVYLTETVNPPIWDKNLQILSVQGRSLVKYEKTFSFSLAGRNSIHYFKDKNYTLIKSKFQEKIKNVIFYKNEYYFNNTEQITVRTFDEKEIKVKRELKFKFKAFIQDFAFVNDTMWIATEGKVYKTFNEKIVDSLIEINSVKVENINRIKMIDDVVYLWNMNGLFVKSSKGNKVLNKYNFLPSNDVYNVTKFNNQLLIATKDGLAKVSEKLIFSKTNAPKLELLYNNQITKKINSSSKQELIKIELQIQNFNSFKNQIIQFKIDDLNWVTTQNKFLNFQSLVYGNHTLSVRVKDVNSNWSTKTITINKEYPFYLKWWFILLINLLVFGLIYFVYSDQIKKIKIKKQLEIDTNNRVVELRQSALSAMMNPHFVFNSLNAIQYFVNSNQKEKSSEQIGKLSRLVRLFLSQAAEPFISLEEELNRLKLYVELEQTRFENFEFVINIDSKIDQKNIKIPNMIVQPFIENAILHGVSHLKDNDGKIVLNFNLNEDILTIEVIDNGFGIDKNKLKNYTHISKGISIITERIEILQQSYPEKVFFIKQENATPKLNRKGYKVEIAITLF